MADFSCFDSETGIKHNHSPPARKYRLKDLIVVSSNSQHLSYLSNIFFYKTTSTLSFLLSCLYLSLLNIQMKTVRKQFVNQINVFILFYLVSKQIIFSTFGQRILNVLSNSFEALFRDDNNRVTIFYLGDVQSNSHY